MLKLTNKPVYLIDGKPYYDGDALPNGVDASRLNDDARRGTMSYEIMMAHNISDVEGQFNIKFDSMASHDITYVGIIQTARASGLVDFPLPYVLTNCHNSLCAVGGTINEDDHAFGLSAAKKYGGIYIPAHQAVIHQYMREMMAGCGSMILGSDSHTRYGALGTMAVGEGGPELVKQLLKRTWDVTNPQVVGIYLHGKPPVGVGPQDIALALVEATFKTGFVKNCVMEFVGPGISDLTIDYRNGIDVMTTETTCLSSIWETDDKVQDYFTMHGRPKAYKKLSPKHIAKYDKFIDVDLSLVKPMIALPFHPSNAFAVEDVIANAKDILGKIDADSKKQFAASGVGLDLVSKISDKGIYVDQGIVAGCSGGTYENIALMAQMAEDGNVGHDEFTLSVYPASQPVFYGLNKIGAINSLFEAGAVIKTAFCGPCFGAGDVPNNGALSIRHTTRNFPNREGSKPGDGQLSGVALMDARSIMATALNGGYLLPATETYVPADYTPYEYNRRIYDNRCYYGTDNPMPEVELSFGPNIKSWPDMIAMPDNLLLSVASVIDDEVTTTDELIPSGETSSYRSNPYRLAEYTLSRKDPEYVPTAKISMKDEENRQKGKRLENAIIANAVSSLNVDLAKTGIGSIIYANKPGDGSAREQAASCQKVLGSWGNIATEYATKRYRSNCVNWGMLPFITKEALHNKLDREDVIYLEGIRDMLVNDTDALKAVVIKQDGMTFNIELSLPSITEDERDIILNGCLINYYRKN